MCYVYYVCVLCDLRSGNLIARIGVEEGVGASAGDERGLVGVRCIFCILVVDTSSGDGVGT